ncbi:ferrous iron transport protein A [Balnearium lithotrophicum]|uniref:Ferrous iron transport protein A n=1 Tax=Balnearium lithotrophicum TaxID=223788 RepID=A0A521C8J8_9BACT|nr:FeoA family protein [Balnearium lithotrophicum]SMO55040.1 ferrous iron transport protein A [Balnearium lithotrophicum]
MRLIDVEEGKTVRVTHVEGGVGLKNRLVSIGIYPGGIVKVVKRPPGPMILEVAGSRIAIGKGMAAKIEVEEV